MCVICDAQGNNFQDIIECSYLSFGNCPNVVRFPEAIFLHLTFLEIYNCPCLEYIPAIEGLIILSLSHLPMLKELPYIQTLEQLYPEGLPLVTNVPLYPNLRHLQYFPRAENQHHLMFIPAEIVAKSPNYCQSSNAGFTMKKLINGFKRRQYCKREFASWAKANSCTYIPDCLVHVINNYV